MWVDIMDNLFTCYIYNIVNKINGKVYVGQTKNTKKRATSHKYMLNKGIHHSKYLQNSFNKYGIENFEFSIIEECTNNNVDDREIFYIQKFKSNNPDYGYNILAGGNSRRDIFENSLMSDEGKKAISERMSNYWEEITSNPEFGRKVIRINDLKIFQYAKKAGDETKTDYYRILENCRKKIDYASIDEYGLPVIWMFLDEWEDSKISYDVFLRNNDISKFKYYYKKVICLNDGKIFNSREDASKYYNLSISSVIRCLSGESSYIKFDDNNYISLMYTVDYFSSGKPHISSIIFDKKSVIDKNKKIIYINSTSAGRSTGILMESISRCCRGVVKSAGKESNGRKIEWCYLEDYEGDLICLFSPYYEEWDSFEIH